MKNHTPKIILLEIVKSFDSYIRILGEAEKMVQIFCNHQLQVAVQKFRFNRFYEYRTDGNSVQLMRSPVQIPEDTGTPVSKVMMMTHETDMETGECFSFLGGRYFLDKIKPAVRNDENIHGHYLN